MSQINKARSSSFFNLFANASISLIEVWFNANLKRPHLSSPFLIELYNQASTHDVQNLMFKCVSPNIALNRSKNFFQYFSVSLISGFPIFFVYHSDSGILHRKIKLSQKIPLNERFLSCVSYAFLQNSTSSTLLTRGGF